MAKRSPTAKVGTPYPDPPSSTGRVDRWPNRERFVWLWHGTDERSANNILRGINLRFCQRKCDFGRGFYTTTFKPQAREWAVDRLLDVQVDTEAAGVRAAVLGFPVPLDALPPLHSLPFVRPEASNELFWSFVRHCRGFPRSDFNNPAHHPDPPECTHLYPHPAGGRCYDMVCGPVARRWGRRPQVYQSYDQYSFHTPATVAMLNALLPSARLEVFVVSQVPRA
jgi:hypothetical protein